MIAKPFNALLVSILLVSILLVSLYPAAAQTAKQPRNPAQAPPPAPTLVTPANGASLVQPITLDWNPVSAPGGPIGSYTWQVGTTADFALVIASGFTNNLSDDFPTPTADKVSGLPNGTYFWRVRDNQSTDSGGVDSDWSEVRTFNVTGLGLAPTRPAISTPITGAQIHASEFFDLKWAQVHGAQYYLLETSEDPSFDAQTSFPPRLIFGTLSVEGWGNEFPALYYRVRAVSVDNVRSLPSRTLQVVITNSAPVPPAPTLLSPAAGATVPIPLTLDWTDTPNPRFASYDLDVDTDPAFPGDFGVLFVPGIARSDYMLTPDLLAPGSYFWRIRTVHGQQPGPWSPGRAITIPALSPSQPVFGLIDINADPSTVYGSNPARARVRLDAPAPAGGATISLSGSLPEINMPGSVFIPAGKTDANVFPIPITPLPGAGGVGTIHAADARESQLGGIGLGPILFGTELSAEAVTGGNSLTGTVTLNSPAPAEGATVRLISSDTSLVTLPATVFIPAGATETTFIIPTSAVSESTRVTIETGTESDGFRAPQASIVLLSPSAPAFAPSLSSLTLNRASVRPHGKAIGTVRLTSPAPTGGAHVTLSGSAVGQSLVPQGGVTVPAGRMTANFIMNIPPVWTTQWPLIQAHYGISGGNQAKILEIVPDPTGPPTLAGMGPPFTDVVGGAPVRQTVLLVMTAPPGGGAVHITSSNPSVVQVPATVTIAEGNSTNSFLCTTSPVTDVTTVQIDATAGGVTRSSFVTVGFNP